MAKSLPVIGLIDMDCFFVQVEQRGKPELDGKPCAVTQYNTYKGGGIIAVNYEARAFGVKRNMRGEDALAKCKDIILFHTPQRRGKADSSKYREASFEVFEVLTNYDSDLVVEKASIDEAYIDLTDYLSKNSELELPTKEEMFDCFVEGVALDSDSNCDYNRRDFDKFYDMIIDDQVRYKDELNLLKGSKIISILRRVILDKTQFYCSAGISHSKVLAKLAAGLHKPKSQTILPNCGKKHVLARTEINKLKSLGGKFGLRIIERLNIKFVDEINNFTIEQLRVLFDEKTADYMRNLANGCDNEKVVARKASSSIGAGKNFSAVGTNCLNTKEQVEHWLGQLVDELLERLDRDKELNNRRPSLLVLSIDQTNIGMLSRSTQFEYFTKQRLVEIVMAKILNPILFKKDNKITNPIRMLSVAATKFVELVDHKNTIDSFFKRMQEKTNELNQIKPSTSAANEAEDLIVNNGQENEQTDNEASNEMRSKTEFQNLNCKKMMNDYFRELEADIVRPKEIVEKPKLTIVNMFNKIAEKTGQDIKTKKDDQQVEEANGNAQCNQDDNHVNQNGNKTAKLNPIIDLINKNNQRLSNNKQPPMTITLDGQPSTSSNRNDQQQESFASNQLKLIREQGLLDESELKKLEDEFLQEARSRRVEKIGFFRRKTLELKEKKKKLKTR